MKKVFVSFLIFELLFKICSGQDLPLYSTIIPPSPNAASLGKYAEIPVSLSSGIPQINVPLYDVTTGGLNLPISISYHASGIRVEEIASWVGLGWSLNAGGVITRTVHGLPDEMPNWGWFAQGAIPSNLDPETDEDDFNLVKRAALGMADWQPDEFYYNFNGHAGMIVFDYDGTPYPVPYENIRITGSINDGWTIVTEDGTSYQFTEGETTTFIPGCVSDESLEGFTEPGPYTSSWYLTKIIQPNTGKEIDLSYNLDTENEIEQVVRNQSIGTKCPGETNWCDQGLLQDCSTIITNQIVRLDRIDYDGGHVEFIPNQDEREDLENDHSLSEIRIFDTDNSLLKKWLFQYSYSGSGSAVNKRLILDQVNEESADEDDNPPYTFEYNDEHSLPSRSSFNQDYWGLFNGSNNGNSFIPYRVLDCGSLGISQGSANREPDVAYAKTAILEKITYPTGGYDDFDYEGNYYGTDQEGEEINDHEIIHHTATVSANSGNTDDYETFTIDNDQWVKIYGERDPASGSYGGNEAEYTLEGSSGFVTVPNSGETIYIYLHDGEYTAHASIIGSSSTALLTINYIETTNTINKNRLGGGLRIHSIVRSDGDDDNSNNTSKIFRYNTFDDPERSSGHLISYPVCTYSSSVASRDPSCLGSTSIGLQCPATLCLFNYTSSSSENTLGQSNGGYVGYTNVDVLMCDDNADCSEDDFGDEGLERYQFSFQEAVPAVYPFPSSTYKSWRSGLMLEKTVYSSAGKKVESQENIYSISTYNKHEIKGFKAGFSVNDPLGDFAVPTCYDHFAFTYYTYVSEWQYLSQTTTTAYDLNDDSKYVTKVTNFFYDNPAHAQLTRTVTTNSDGITYTTTMRYPDDYSSNTSPTPDAGAIMRMKSDDLHMINKVVEKTTSIQKPNESEKVISGSLIKYLEFATDQILPAEQWQLQTDVPIDNYVFSDINSGSGDLEYNSAYQQQSQVLDYDTHGNPIVVQKTYDIPVSYQWGYNNLYPVAEIKNSPEGYSGVCSFEYDGNVEFSYSAGGISIAGQGNNLPFAKTGINYYSLASGSVQCLVSNSGDYTLSFWSRGSVTLNCGSQNITNVINGDADANGWYYYEYEVDDASAASIVLSGTTQLDEVRFYPVKGQMKSLTYNADGTIIDINDENNITSYFEYDGFQRLNWSEDEDRNALTYNKYHYKDPQDADDHNYILNENMLTDGLDKNDIENGSAYTPEDIKKEIQYFDGLGRLIQTNDRDQSTNEKDIISFNQYDAFGREPNMYLPYTITATGDYYHDDMLDEQENFYTNQADVATTNYPYGFNVFEPSPLNRVTEQAPPGETWHNDHHLRIKQRSNVANEIRYWKIVNGVWNANNTYYDAGQLDVDETWDENSHYSMKATDKNGKLICEYHQVTTFPVQQLSPVTMMSHTYFAITYYIYDDFGQLVEVIQPEGMNEMLGASGLNLTQTVRTKWCFEYTYDERHRMVTKTIPAKGTEYIVYDLLDRPVLTQDENQRLANDWLFTKYDILSRSVITGIYNDASHTNRTDMQDFVTSKLLSNAYTLFESRTGNFTVDLWGYDNTSFPPAAHDKCLTITYYDNYDFDDGHILNGLSVGFIRVRNKVTGMLTQVLDGTGQTYEKLGNIYDNRYRLIQTRSINFEDYNEDEDFEYDFAGRLLSHLQDNNSSLGTHEFTFTYTYDHASRPLETIVTADGAEIDLTKLDYNELGQLLSKKLHFEDVAGNLAASNQVVDYTYNIRGWLTEINHVSDMMGTNPPDDMWSETIHYDDGNTSTDMPADNQYNGNISWVEWYSAHSKIKRGYAYTYDAYNRLLNAYYAADDPDNNVSDWLGEANHYMQGNIDYDFNGNILSMKTYGVTAESSNMFTYGLSDALSYEYNGNVLQKVIDGGDGAWSHGLDFRDGTNTNDDYLYDANGNMTKDRNKDLGIDYNVLNLPAQISNNANGIQILYDASGRKLKEVTSDNGSTTTKMYSDNLVYENDVPRLQHDDGYLLWNESAQLWEDYYYIKDHLGNVRIVFRGQKIKWDEKKLTMELQNSQEENDQFDNVNPFRNTHEEYEGNFSAKIIHTEGPYTELPVKNGDTLQLTVYHKYDVPQNNNQQRTTNPDANKHPLPFDPDIQIELQPHKPKLIGGEVVQHDPPQIGIQLNLIGLFTKKKNELPENDDPQQRTMDSTNEVPQAYVKFELKDTSGATVSTWQINIDSTDAWNKIGDSLKITTPDTTQQYTLKVSLKNDSYKPIWFDTLNLKLGVQVDAIIQEIDYYPYGNIIDGLYWNEPSSDKNHRLYNMKEWHQPMWDDASGASTFNLNWNDYGWRWSDPQIGVWHVVDDFSEKYLQWSPYSYGSDNPVGKFDIDGREVDGWPGLPGLRTYIRIATGNTQPITDWVAQKADNIFSPIENGSSLQEEHPILSSLHNILISGENEYIAAPVTTIASNDASFSYKVEAVVALGTLLSKEGTGETPLKTYETYTIPLKDGSVYSGRTSGFKSPEENVANRTSSSHHMQDQFDGQPTLDVSSTNAEAIRGREQQLINVNGGAQSQKGISGNKINGVSPNNPMLPHYLEQSVKEFGDIIPK